MSDTKCHLDQMMQRQNCTLMKCHSDKMLRKQNATNTKCWQGILKSCLTHKLLEAKMLFRQKVIWAKYGCVQNATETKCHMDEKWGRQMLTFEKCWCIVEEWWRERWYATKSTKTARAIRISTESTKSSNNVKSINNSSNSNKNSSSNDNNSTCSKSNSNSSSASTATATIAKAKTVIAAKVT